MSIHAQPRRPAGAPAAEGGRFASTSRPEPRLTLGPEVEVDDPDETIVSSWEKTGAGDSEFNRRVRALLGVADQRRKVTVAMAGQTYMAYGTDSTLESWEAITLTCAGRTRDFGSLPELMRHLEFADAPVVDQARVRPMIGHRVTVHTTTRTQTGTVENCNGYLLWLRPEGHSWPTVVFPRFDEVLHIELAPDTEQGG